MTPSSALPVKAARSVTLAAEAKELASGLRNARRWYLQRTSYSLRLPADDPLYADAHAWMLSLLPELKRRSLLARSTIGPVSSPIDEDEPRSDDQQLLLTSTDTSEQHVLVDGHRVAVYVEKPDRGPGKWNDPEVLVFTARSRDGQQAVARHLSRLLADRTLSARRPVMRLLNTSWGSWNRRGDLPTRPVDSVILAPGQMERIIEDLGRFLADESTYNSRAVPWHRGYLFHGPPGTGKTSIAKAMATAHGLDLWYAPLGDVKDDSGLLNLLSQVHPRSMLLLEDVDVFAATQDRSPDSTARLSLSGLLNALDGVATPHGLVTVMTTNTPEVLDSAVIRPGRIDLVEAIARPDDEQVDRMYAAFYGQRSALKLKSEGRSAAEVTEVFKKHMHDPAGAMEALRGHHHLTTVDPRPCGPCSDYLGRSVRCTRVGGTEPIVSRSCEAVMQP